MCAFFTGLNANYLLSCVKAERSMLNWGALVQLGCPRGEVGDQKPQPRYLYDTLHTGSSLVLLVVIDRI